MANEMTQRVWEMLKKGYFTDFAKENDLKFAEDEEGMSFALPFEGGSYVTVGVSNFSKHQCFVRFAAVLGSVDEPSRGLMRTMLEVNASSLVFGALGLAKNGSNFLFQYEYSVLGDTIDKEEFEVGMHCAMSALGLFKQTELKSFRHEISSI